MAIHYLQLLFKVPTIESILIY